MSAGDEPPLPFPFGDLPPLADGPADELPDWLADATPPAELDPSVSTSVPYWPGIGADEPGDVNAILLPRREPAGEDTLTDCPRADDFPPLPPLTDQISPTERMPFDFPAADDLPLPPPFEANLSELSPFAPPPEPPAVEQPPTLVDTPPPAAKLDLPPVSAIWRTRRVTVEPRAEEGGTVAVYRLVVRDAAGRGYANCKVTFALPAGLKQVQASRKPAAKKGVLHWNLGPLGPDEDVPLSVKLPVARIGPELARSPRTFEVSYQPLPGAKLVGELASPAAVLPGEPFTIDLKVSNTGELPTGAVMVRVVNRSHGGKPVLTTAAALAPGEAVSLAVELVAPGPGRHDWIATVESAGSEPAESTFSTDAVEAKLGLELKHDSMLRVDEEGEVTLVVANPSPVAARGVTALLTMPEELTFALAAGGEFDRSLNLIGWPIGDIPAGETRRVSARLRGFAPGLVGIQARAEGLTGGPAVTSSNLFVEVDARATSSSLDKLLAAMQDAVPADDEPEAVRERAVEGARHVVFELAGTQYAVRIEHVREVVRSARVTPVPGLPDWLPGVANVRGDVVSIVDLPRFLGVGEPDAAHRGVLVTQSADGQFVIGFLVTDVVGIRRLPAPRPVEADLLGDDSLAGYLSGIVELHGKLVPLLDLNALFASAELNAFQAA